MRRSFYNQRGANLDEISHLRGGGSLLHDIPLSAQLVQGQKNQAITGEARQGDRHCTPFRIGRRITAKRREILPEGQSYLLLADKFILKVRSFQFGSVRQAIPGNPFRKVQI